MSRSTLAMSWRPLLMLLGLLAAVAVATPARADPPARAARVSFISGSASFSPAGSDDWLQARINRPLWIGDRLWSGDGRVELQIGGASLRLAPRTLLRVLNFDDRLAQFEVPEGSVALHVRAIDRDDAIEIDTPTFAFVTQEEGDYRIDVERDRTAVSARRGFGDVYGAQVAYRIDRRERYVFFDADLRDYDAGPLPRPDPFDRWARERASREDASASARYVNPELVGYVDLDSYGEWRNDASYGNVWVPRVAADWAPYRYGHWTWIDPWGWTWIDDAPWGYAPAHYGRWTQIGRTWAWVPGPRETRPVYAPALVAWVGGDNFSLTVASGRSRGVAWFPLAPGEVWRPPYEVSRDYFTRVNVSNTVVNQTSVINVYESRNSPRDAEQRYRYRQAAVTAVPVETLVRSRPVQQNIVQVTNNVVVNAPVVAAPRAQPTAQSFGGGAPAAQARPPAESTSRRVIARTAPPAAVPTLQDRAAMIQSQQGQPVDRAALDRVAPQGAPAPGATHALPPAQVPAGQAPRERAAPNQLRSNVRVVDAERAGPKPLPPENARGGRDEKGRPETRQAAPGQPQAPQPAQAAQPQTGEPRAPQAAQPQSPRAAQPPQAAQPQPPQAAQPQPPQAAQPQPPQAAQPRPPQAATPQAGRPGQAQPPQAPEPPRAAPPQAQSARGGAQDRSKDDDMGRPSRDPQSAPSAMPPGGPARAPAADERRPAPASAQPVTPQPQPPVSDDARRAQPAVPGAPPPARREPAEAPSAQRGTAPSGPAQRAVPPQAAQPGPPPSAQPQQSQAPRPQTQSPQAAQPAPPQPGQAQPPQAARPQSQAGRAAQPPRPQPAPPQATPPQAAPPPSEAAPARAGAPATAKGEGPPAKGNQGRERDDDADAQGKGKGRDERGK